MSSFGDIVNTLKTKASDEAHHLAVMANDGALSLAIGIIKPQLLELQSKGLTPIVNKLKTMDQNKMYNIILRMLSILYISGLLKKIPDHQISAAPVEKF
jgi:hypothetical protein